MSSVASMTMGAALLGGGRGTDDEVGGATLAGGAAGALLSLLIGIPLALTSDTTSLVAVGGS